MSRKVKITRPIVSMDNAKAFESETTVSTTAANLLANKAKRAEYRKQAEQQVADLEHELLGPYPIIESRKADCGKQTASVFSPEAQEAIPELNKLGVWNDSIIRNTHQVFYGNVNADGLDFPSSAESLLDYATPGYHDLASLNEVIRDYILTGDAFDAWVSILKTPSGKGVWLKEVIFQYVSDALKADGHWGFSGSGGACGA